jgi:hypothetical protein
VDEALKYKIYYGDGRTYTGDPVHAPTLNVQVIAVADKDGTNGRALLHSRDVYWWTEDGWTGGDLFGFHQYLFTPHITKYAVFGTSIDTGRFREILERAKVEGLD